MSEESSEKITKKAKSNLAFAFMGLPPETKRNLTRFYAFCRVVDDIADEIGPSAESKEVGMARWRAVVREEARPETELEENVVELLALPNVESEAFLGIIDGCASDIESQRFPTMGDLLKYTYGVASCVGIVSVILFGASPKAREYGIILGHGLQITNILRDVGEDWHKEERIYLPLDVMAQYNYSQEDVQSGVYNESFVAMMNDLADRADAFYEQRAQLYASLSRADRKALAPMETMMRIYKAVLDAMRRDGFRVYEKRYTISDARKLWLLIKSWIVARF